MTAETGGELIREALWFDDGFTTIPNSWARDPRITHQARGLLVQIASHKAGFRISIASLTAGALNGRDAIQSQLNELQRAGYLQRDTYRDRGMKRYRYRLRDPHSPVENDGQAAFALDGLDGKNPRSAQSPGNPYPGNPYTGNPSTENPDTKEELLKNTLTGSLPEVTTERPVDNSPASAPVQGQSEAQSARPSGGSAASAARYSALIAQKCSGRRVGDHSYEDSGYCRHCGTRRPDEGRAPLVVNTTTGEVA